MARAIRIIEIEGDWDAIIKRMDTLEEAHYDEDDHQMMRIIKTKYGVRIKVDARDYKQAKRWMCRGKLKCLK